MKPRVLSLAKDGHEYVFRYTPGHEDEVVDEIVATAEDSTNSFDWVDAATLSFQVTQYAAADCLGEFAPNVEEATEGPWSPST